MIDEIHVRNIALIREGSINPSSGLTAITGETGAGKTALLSACKLLMGMRSDRGLVREGQDQAQTQGRFFVEDQTFEEELVVKRNVSADGRSRAQINGDMVSVGELFEKISPLIDLCSQHDQQKLLHTSTQRDLLDLWIGSDCLNALDEYKQAFNRVNEIQSELNSIKRDVSEATLEEARFVLNKIEDLNPQIGEYEELLKSLEISENAETIASSANNSYSVLSEEGGVLDQLISAIVALDEGAKYDESLQGYVQSLREANFILEDVSRELASYKESIEYNPETLEANQERVANYQSILRNYGPTLDNVFSRAEEAKTTIEMVDNAQEIEDRYRRQLEEAESKLAESAFKLSEIRKLAAPKFALEVNNVMADLEMGNAIFVCDAETRSRDQWTSNGADLIEFKFCPGKGMQARPLSRIASGGELSRVMLALHVIMGAKDNISTLVFDEIDAGVGGSTAKALANVMSRLSKTHQVIVVTHLAQVAAVADKQYVVTKGDAGSGEETFINDVSGNARIEEIARMLSGSVTDTSLAHAKELLAI